MHWGPVWILLRSIDDVLGTRQQYYVALLPERRRLFDNYAY
jgi:hypothetical protein